MKQAVSERVRCVISEKGFSSVFLSEKAKLSQPTIARQINGAINVSIELLYAVLHECPDISSEWILMGKGNKYITDNLPPMTGNETEIQLLEAANETLREKIKGLERTVSLQESLIKEKDKRLAMFEELLHGSHEDYIEEKRKSV